MRKQLLREFRKIDREIPTEHGEKEMLVMANFLPGLEIDGCIIECGCYMGAVLPHCFSQHDTDVQLSIRKYLT